MPNTSRLAFLLAGALVVSLAVKQELSRQWTAPQIAIASESASDGGTSPGKVLDVHNQTLTVVPQHGWQIPLEEWRQKEADDPVPVPEMASAPTAGGDMDSSDAEAEAAAPPPSVLPAPHMVPQPHRAVAPPHRVAIAHQQPLHRKIYARQIAQRSVAFQPAYAEPAPKPGIKAKITNFFRRIKEKLAD